MAEENFDITKFVDGCGCFDLQFRKDTRHKRTGSPTYYRWKMQFVVTAPKSKTGQLEKICKNLRCGKINIIKDQARFSVQKIEDINSAIIPFFKKNPLSGKKKSDFGLWQKAAEIIGRNKGKPMSDWRRNEFLQLIEIQKSSIKYKERPRQTKWLKTAQDLAKILK